jgi:tape measure domain-containing protein
MSAPLLAVQHAISGVTEYMAQLQKSGQLKASGLDRMKNQVDMSSAAVKVLGDEYLRVTEKIGGAGNKQDGLNNKIKQGQSAAGGLLGEIGKMVKAYAGLRTVKAGVELSDTMTNAKQRLKLINDGTQTEAELQNKIFQSAQRSRGAYTDTLSTVAKLGLTAKKAFSGNDEIIAFAEQVNKQFVIGGAGAQEQASATYQLTQAMQSGRLQGDEYRSIIENAPLLATSIEDYMRNAGVEGTMKEWASEGLLTAEVIKNALFSVADETNRMFEQMPMTWGQVWTKMKNYGIRALEPVLDKINDIANSGRMDKIFQGVTAAVAKFAEILTWVLGVASKIAAFFVDNWKPIAPIVWAITAAFIGWKLAALATTIQTWALKVANDGLNATLHANPLMWIISLIGLLVGAIMWWINSVGGIQNAWTIFTNKIKNGWDRITTYFKQGWNVIKTIADYMMLAWLIVGDAILTAVENSCFC